MKFSCEDCGAKYKVPDEKVAGRTLKMKCRKCGEMLIIRGDRFDSDRAPDADLSEPPEPFEGQSEPPPPSAPPAKSSTPSSRPSSDRAKPVSERARAAASNAVPERAETLDPLFAPRVPTRLPDEPAAGEKIWHVSINDVPVGPISANEVWEKYRDGIIQEHSLVWKEGLTEWQPLGAVAELAAMVISSPVSMPKPSTPPPLSAPPPRASVPAMAPIGLYGAPAMAPEHYSMPPAGVLHSPYPPPGSYAPPPGSYLPPGSVAVPMRRPAAFYFLLLTLAIALPLAALGTYLLGKKHGEADALTRIDDEVQIARLQREKELRAEFDKKLDDLKTAQMEFSEEDVAAASDSSTKADTNQDRRNTRTTARRIDEAPSDAPAEKELSDDERRLLTQFSQPSGAAIKEIGASDSGMAAIGVGSTAKAEPLDDRDVANVVNQGKRGLQLCYERAVRGQAGGQAIKMTVQISVAPSGRVTESKVNGNGPGGLSECIKSNVSRWRFPRSSDGGQTQFPLLFQPK
ncbi:MAG: GYF domain-containing protein [Polyangiales bacterium]